MLILGLGPYVAPLPLAALSAIVMLVGWRMIEFSFLLKVPRMDPRYSSVMLLVMAVTIFVDPIFAIMLGVIAANIVNAAQLESLELDSLISTPLLESTFSAEAADSFTARIGLVSFRGSFTVSSSRKLIALIGADIRDHEVVIFDLSNATHVDDSAAHLLAQVIDRAKQTRTEIVVFGINHRIRGPLFAFDVLDRIPDDRIVATEKEAGDLSLVTPATVWRLNAPSCPDLAFDFRIEVSRREAAGNGVPPDDAFDGVGTRGLGGCARYDGERSDDCPQSWRWRLKNSMAFAQASSDCASR